MSWFLFFTSIAQAVDWPHWRGPERNDITTEVSGWVKGKPWPAAKSAWKIATGTGCSTPIIVQGHLYALGWKNNADHLYCVDAATGKEVWKQSYPCPQFGRQAMGDQGMYAGPSSTPEYDTATGYLYTLSVDGDLNCWDTKAKGKKVWGLNLYDKYKVERRPRVGSSGWRDYGYTSAALVHGDWVLVEVGSKQGSVIAFDRKTGAQRWASALKDPAGHTGGLVPMTIEGVPCVTVLTHFHLAVIRLDAGHEGKTVATHPWVTEFANSIATPAVQDHYVLITSAYNKYAICKLDISLKGAKQLWEQPYPSGVCSPIIYKGHVYLSWNKVRCLDFTSGAEKWSGGAFGTPGSCIVTGDEKLIVWGERGLLALVETAQTSPQKYSVLAQQNLNLDLAWPHVVLANGRLYCKDRTGLILCFALS
jgi:outer membrane protein assembly factor BamB